ncbi:MAG: hypothetical protein ACFB2X_07850 [Rivularia sp. (in: cyanobacteria)]
MNNNQNQPREFDVVLGGNTSPPVTGAVLGGIEGVKRRLESDDEEVRIAALWNALNYGNVGLDLVIAALEDSSLKIKSFAAKILKKFGGKKGKKVLLEFDPYLYFIKLEYWDFEEINPEIGITNLEKKADLIVEQLMALINENRLKEVETVLSYLINYKYQYLNEQEYGYINILLSNSQIWNTYKQLLGKR